MTGYHESPSASSDGGAVLIVGVNWVGDSIMAMPALQAFRRQHPEADITLMVKGAMRNLWALHEVPNRIVTLESGLAGVRSAVREIKRLNCDRAFILPHSFRSSLAPWLARIPERIGMPGHQRDWMLSKVIKPDIRPGRAHQAYEYLDLLTPGWGDQPPEAPRLRIPEEARADAGNLLGDSFGSWIGMIPGAARGPSKQWPKAHFQQLARSLVETTDSGIALFGTPSEKSLCTEIAEAVGVRARNFAGETTFLQWTALLEACRVVIANDSGGMHLAAALQRPVVALYGITDPDTTGPLGKQSRVLQKSERRSRGIARDSAEAIAALKAITPEEVLEAVRLMDSGASQQETTP